MQRYNGKAKEDMKVSSLSYDSSILAPVLASRSLVVRNNRAK